LKCAYPPSGYAVIDAGTFDYAADAWGCTVDGAAEWYVGSWAPVRLGMAILRNPVIEY